MTSFNDDDDDGDAELTACSRLSIALSADVADTEVDVLPIADLPPPPVCGSVSFLASPPAVATIAAAAAAAASADSLGSDLMSLAAAVSP